jgi:hypothetical protein
MQHQPALLDRALEAGFVFRRRRPFPIQHRFVNLFDVDAAILHRLDGVRYLDDFAGSHLGISERTRFD